MWYLFHIYVCEWIVAVRVELKLYERTSSGTGPKLFTLKVKNVKTGNVALWSPHFAKIFTFSLQAWQCASLLINMIFVKSGSFIMWINSIGIISHFQICNCSLIIAQFVLHPWLWHYYWHHPEIPNPIPSIHPLVAQHSVNKYTIICLKLH